jgi:hypothetical protein
VGEYLREKGETELERTGTQVAKRGNGIHVNTCCDKQRWRFDFKVCFKSAATVN